jgi:amino acid transporter
MNVTTATATLDTPTTTRTRFPLLRAGAVSGVAAAVATEVVAAVARASDVSMQAGSVGADSSEPIPVFGFAFATLLWTAVGIGMAAAMGRWAKHPARTFTITTVALTIVSLVPPALAGATTTGTKLILALTHVVAALIVVPVLRRELVNRASR